VRINIQLSLKAETDLNRIRVVSWNCSGVLSQFRFTRESRINQASTQKELVGILPWPTNTPFILVTFRVTLVIFEVEVKLHFD